MSTETSALVERLWQADDLDLEAERAGESLTTEQSGSLRAIVAELEARISAKRVLDRSEPRDDVLASSSADTTKGLLILLVLASYHSDTLFFLPAEARHERVRQWSERTGFPTDFVKEAVILGPRGLTPMLEAA